MDFQYVCHVCGAKYDPGTLVFRCKCGGLFDLAKWDMSFVKEDIVANEWSLFRYQKVLPFPSGDTIWKDISMGEGFTPLLLLESGKPNIWIKMDYLMPTLSFKDRGAVVLIAKAKEYGVPKVIQDSSGNAGTAIAAYAGRAGIACDIYVPAHTSAKKIKQIASHGAAVHVIQGSREDTAKAALQAAERGEGFYASHVYNPFFYQGTKTYAYELYEQFDGNLPETLVIPVGNGTLLLGAYYGLQELHTAGLIHKIPRILAVQAQGCAPIYRAYQMGEPDVTPVSNTGTQAEGIAIADPKRGRQIMDAVRATGGEVIIAPEDRIQKARSYLASKGFYVELTTAATFAGFMDHYEKEKLDMQKDVVIPLCGAGLKSD